MKRPVTGAHPAGSASSTGVPPGAPTVSVVINNYNYGRFLRECVESALRQTVACEVVVVDDGSTDESLSVLDEFGDRIVVVRQENSGQAAAVNVGVERSTGDVLAFLDSDDVMREDRVERIAEAFVEDPGLGWVRHNMTLADVDGTVLQPTMYPTETVSDPFADLVAFGDTYGTTSGLCFSRWLFERVGPVPQELYRYYADAYLILAGGLTGRCRTITEPLCTRRQHPHQVTGLRRPRPDHVRDLIALRGHLADTAARLTEGSPSGAALARGGAWWQRKAELQRSRTEGGRLLRRLDLLWRFATSLGQAPLSPGSRAGFLLRDLVLTLVPRAQFESLWWYSHDGRPVLTRSNRTDESALQRADGVGHRAVPGSGAAGLRSSARS